MKRLCYETQKTFWKLCDVGVQASKLQNTTPGTHSPTLFQNCGFKTGLFYLVYPMHIRTWLEEVIFPLLDDKGWFTAKGPNRVIDWEPIIVVVVVASWHMLELASHRLLATDCEASTWGP